MLVVPLHIHGEPAGTVAFYWRSFHRFTDSEIRIASALGNMAAAALGTSDLYEREKQLRSQAQLAEQRAAFLAEAGSLLASSLDYETTLRSVAKLAVPAFADWCAVDVYRNGSLERVTVEHIDPAKVQLAQAYRQKYPVGQDDASILVFRTAKSLLVEHVSKELLIDSVKDPERLQMVLAMGIESLMVVPMLHRELTLGVLSFVSSEPGRRYTDADLTLAEELARRAAGAIDNARLFTESQAVQASLQQVNEELNRANQELQRANEDLNQFAYSASHDLQEPLRMVSAYTQLLQKRYGDRLDAEADRYIECAVQGARRIETLLRDILSYTRSANIDSDQSLSSDAGQVIHKVLATLEQSILETGAIVTVGPLPTVAVAEIHMVQLFQNLLGNAIKYSGETRPAVSVTACPEENFWIFSVRDNGLGIDPRYKELIFGLFKRLHRNDEYGGTGIGLAICQKIVERYGGRIWVESEPGRGADFRFTLPKSDEPVCC